MSTGKRFLITALTFLLALSLLLPSVMQRPAADTQTGFILLSPGRDGKIGTSDDMYATEKGDAVKGAVDTTKYSSTDSVPSNNGGKTAFLGFNISSWDKAIIDGNWYTYAQEYGPFYVTWKGSLSNMRLRIKAEPKPTRTNSAVWLYVLDTNNKYLPFEYIKNDKSAVTTSAPIGTVIYSSGKYISIPETVDIIIPDGAAKLMFGGDSPFKIYEMQVVNN